MVKCARHKGRESPFKSLPLSQKAIFSSEVLPMTEQKDPGKPENKLPPPQNTTLLHTIVGLDEMVVQLDPSLKITYVNSTLARALGKESKHLAGKPLSDIDNFTWGPDFLGALIKESQAVGEAIVKERRFFDRGKGVDVCFRITVSRIEKGFQILMADRTEYLELEKEFARYVSPKVIEAMKREGSNFSLPRRYRISVLFADLRGFTSMSEHLNPEDVRETLNFFIETMISVAESNDAMVDKIVGDQVMILCGAPIPRPDHAPLAVKVGLEMLTIHKRLINAWAREGKVMPQIGIGVNTGEAVIGNIGINRRSDFTAIGHTVNLASRFCDMAEGGSLFVTEDTKNEVLQFDQDFGQKINIEEKSPVKVKGVEKMVRVFSFSTLDDKAQEIKTLPLELGAKKSSGLSGKIFGKYQVLEEAGRGGMGIVYKALHAQLNRVVALKFLKAGDFAQETQIKMFHREIMALAKLNHPNIIKIHDVGTENNQRYFTMEYLDGCTLDELLDSFHDAQSSGTGSSFKEVVVHVQKQKTLARKGKSHLGKASQKKAGRFRALSPSHALNIQLKIVRAVEHAHDRGTLHRDIKPSNIMITKDGEPILMDFGLARELIPGESMNLTQTGQVLGTPAYMSPEQAGGEKDKISERSDIYSLGCVFYEMLTGRPPFIPTGNAMEDIKAVVEREPKKVCLENDLSATSWLNQDFGIDS